MGRAGTGCPWPWALVLLAERFKCLPWHLEEEPTDSVLYYVGLLSIESEYREDTRGMGQGEALYDLEE